MTVNPQDMYVHIEQPPQPMRNCACCGSVGRLWKYRADPDNLVYKPGCSNVDGFGSLGQSECPMYELDHLARATMRQAIKDWNQFCDQLTASRSRSNRSKP